jgi:hypothetical protein
MLVICLALCYYIFSVLPPKVIRKERKTHPWHFNVQPLGSPMYILQEDFNNALEETHRLYYDVYLPCKRKADELIIDKNNREGELYKGYQDIVKLDACMRKCTPNQRIEALKKQIQKKDMQFALKVAGITTVVMVGAVAAFSGMVNNAGKDIGSGSKWKETWKNMETGEEFSSDPRNW